MIGRVTGQPVARREMCSWMYICRWAWEALIGQSLRREALGGFSEPHLLLVILQLGGSFAYELTPTLPGAGSLVR